jgi:protein-tyrosine sulfotransferase
VKNNNGLLNDVKKYFAYFFETKGFTTDLPVDSISDEAMRASRQARGITYRPAIMIQGIMPRSGTVYIGELLRRHPDLYAYPYHLWEFPALQMVGEVRQLQRKFLLAYKPNVGKLANEEFLPLFGASLIAYLYEQAPANRRVLVKMPSAQYLQYFFSMFPNEQVLVLIRDGRDIVSSTLRTWPRLNFIQVCLRWNRSARAVLGALDHFKQDRCHGYWVARYEDALADPEAFVHEACKHHDLDSSIYPFEQIDTIRVIGSSKLAQGKVTWRHLKRPANFRPGEYWRQWSSLRKAIFKAIAGRSLIDLGYSEDLSW